MTQMTQLSLPFTFLYFFFFYYYYFSVLFFQNLKG